MPGFVLCKPALAVLTATFPKHPDRYLNSYIVGIYRSRDYLTLGSFYCDFRVLEMSKLSFVSHFRIHD